MSYPGANVPAWWYTTASTSNVTWTQPFQFQQTAVSPNIQMQAQSAPPARPKTNVALLRERVAEVCGLAFEAAA